MPRLLAKATCDFRPARPFARLVPDSEGICAGRDLRITGKRSQNRLKVMAAASNFLKRGSEVATCKLQLAQVNGLPVIEPK